jgi:hypothetical protein
MILRSIHTYSYTQNYRPFNSINSASYFRYDDFPLALLRLLTLLRRLPVVVVVLLLLGFVLFGVLEDDRKNPNMEEDVEVEDVFDADVLENNCCSVYTLEVGLCSKRY